MTTILAAAAIFVFGWIVGEQTSPRKCEHKQEEVRGE
jgi:hypothetical protein